MTLAFDLSDLPGDAIGLLLLMLISFLGWLKNRFSKPEEEPELDEEERRAREIVWRRQIGEDDGERAPWETDPTVWHPETAATPPPIPTPKPARPPAIPQVVLTPQAAAPKISEKEKRLAEAFENQTGGRRRSTPRTPLARALRAPGAARQAVLLSELLGPPVALREPGERHP